MLGLPGGKVCEDEHLPEYQQQFASLKKLGVERIVIVVPKPAHELNLWGKSRLSRG